MYYSKINISVHGSSAHGSAQLGLTAIAQSTAAAFGCTAELEFGQVQKNGGEA